MTRVDSHHVYVNGRVTEMKNNVLARIAFREKIRPWDVRKGLVLDSRLSCRR